jgi:SAM-dependent MidA family methyltransferase
MQSSPAESVSTPLSEHIRAAIVQAGGWLPFDRFMALALYTPGLGYYANESLKFGHMPDSGSDFVTAPELTPLFGHAVALQVAEALRRSGTDELFEFGAGSGALAEQLLDALDAAGAPLRRYTIVDLSGTLKARQAARLARFGERVVWRSEWPDAMRGVVVANELLDAIPVQLLHFDGDTWLERGVACHTQAAESAQFVFADRQTTLRPPVDQPFLPGTVTEIHPQAEAFVATLARHLVHGIALFFDYGFPESEYYHRQRHGGTLMCHQAHRADADPLVEVGAKDITAHVNFTAVALAAQEAGMPVAGYTSQGRFLLNCGMADLLPAASLRERSLAMKLIDEHEMGELFKVLALVSTDLADYVPLGFASGDRMHRL